jgi:23S rRNA pseudouridine2605 synthase
VLAAAGFGSRREIEAWIRDGRLDINGAPATLGSRIVPGLDRLRLDGRPLRLTARPPAARVLVYNKPEGEVCTRRDPEGRDTVFAALPGARGQRWLSIGRLDLNTTGLLLFTTDGELANALMHPSREVEREYLLRVRGEVDAGMLERLRAGVELEDGPAAFRSIRELPDSSASHRWFTVVICEGRKREVRRLWESQGVQVSRLKRLRYGPVSLPRTLRRGQWQELDQAAVAGLRALAGLAPADSVPRPRRSGPRS